MVGKIDISNQRNAIGGAGTVNETPADAGGIAGVLLKVLKYEVIRDVATGRAEVAAVS